MLSEYKPVPHTILNSHKGSLILAFHRLDTEQTQRNMSREKCPIRLTLPYVAEAIVMEACYS